MASPVIGLSEDMHLPSLEIPTYVQTGLYIIGSLVTIFLADTPTPNHGMQMKRRYIQLTTFTLNADYMKTTLYTAVQKMNKKMQL